MNPSAYVPAYLEHCYLLDHPGLTPAAQSLAREQIARDPERFARTPHAQALASYMRVHEALHAGMRSLEDLPDDDFERQRTALFEQTAEQLRGICAADELCIDAQLVSIQLADTPLDTCLEHMRALELHARGHLAEHRPGLDMLFGGPQAGACEGPRDDAPNRDDSPAETPGIPLTPADVLRDPELVGWLHTLEALAQGCLFTARYRAAAAYARTAMRVPGYASRAVGTLLFALARLEDEEGFFNAVRDGGEGTEDRPWFLLARTLLFYKLGQERSAKRALRDFSNRCEGGAFFLLNPTYHDPYLPVRPEPGEPWGLAHQAVWEADGIISDIPDFALWAEGVEGVREVAESFALRNGF